MKKSFLPFFASLIFLASLVLAAPCNGPGKTGAKGKCTHGMKNAAKCGDKCPVKGHEVTKVEKNASLTGKILCLHCDLHKSDTCEKVLVTADNTVYRFCPDSLGDVDLKSYAGKSVAVKGMVHILKEGYPVIHVKEFNKS